MPSSRGTPTNPISNTYGGVARDYQLLATWEAATDVDMVATTTSYILNCYDDAASFDDTVSLSGSAGDTDASYYRVIKPGGTKASGWQGHDGTPNNGVTFSKTINVACIIFEILEDYSQVQDLIVIITGNTAVEELTGIFLAGAESKGIGCIGKATNAGAGWARPFHLFAQKTTHYINCLAYECKVMGFRVCANAGLTAYNLNCTAINCAIGFRMEQGGSAGTAVVTNAVAQDNATADFSSDGLITETVNHCLSKDATANNWGGDDNHEGVTLTFHDAINYDWHLDSADTDAIGGGHDLSATFDDDIDFTVRSTWDIGFDEYEPGVSSESTKMVWS